MAMPINKYLRFTALEDNCVISIDDSTFYFSKNNGATWSSKTITLNTGEVALVKAANGSNRKEFSASKKVKVGGSIMSLIQSVREDDDPETTIPDGVVFASLFSYCENLTDISELELPATQLTEDCYYAMFYNCSNLTTLPTNLLPATTLKKQCYYAMFSGCSNLLVAPDLPATSLAMAAYSGLFKGCSKINRIKVSFTTWGVSAIFVGNWVEGVAAKGFFDCPSELPREYGTSRIPYGWDTEETLHKPFSATFLNKLKIGGRAK